MLSRCTATSAALLILARLATPVHAAEVTLLTAGAFRQVVVALAPVFVQQTGDHLRIENDTSGALEQRIAGGAAFDVTILPPRAIDTLAGKNKVQADTKVVLARTGVGIVVKAGDPLPDISTVDALRQTLLTAKSIERVRSLSIW